MGFQGLLVFYCFQKILQSFGRISYYCFEEPIFTSRCERLDRQKLTGGLCIRGLFFMGFCHHPSPLWFLLQVNNFMCSCLRRLNTTTHPTFLKFSYHILLPESIIAIKQVEFHWKIIFLHFHQHMKDNLSSTVHHTSVKYIQIVVKLVLKFGNSH